MASEQIWISTFSTVVIRGVDHERQTPMVIRSYFQQMHPSVTIRCAEKSTFNLHLLLTCRTITWAKDTRKLRRLLLRLDFAQVPSKISIWRRKNIYLGGEEMVGESSP